MRSGWRVRCQFAEQVVQTGDDRSILLSTMPATSRDRRVALAVVRHLVGSVRMRRAICRCAARAGAGVRRQLPVRARRSTIVITAVLLFSQFAVSRSRASAAARERISVHRGRRDRACPHLSRPVRAHRTVRRGSTDDGLALHDLARRISASRARICAAQGGRGRHQDTYFDRQADPRKHHCRRRCDFGAGMGRHSQT